MVLRFVRLRGAALAVVAFGLGTSLAAHALEAPTWKFEPGLKNRYRMTQTMKMSMSLPGGGQSNPTVTSIIDMSWVVDKVDDEGAAVLKQKMDRIRMTVESAGAQPMEFDSQSVDEPEGFAAMVAPMAAELTKTEFVVTMTRRGKIIDVQIPEAAVKAIAAAPGAQLMGDMASEEGLKTMIMRSAFEMPETLEAGTEWTNTSELNNPIFGKQTIETTYRYIGPKESDGVRFEVFEPKLVIEFAGGPATASITKQESSGEILFNRDAGRLELTGLQHNVTMAITSGGATVNQTLEQTIQMKWLPEEADED
jgi:hypothetical protein